MPLAALTRVLFADARILCFENARHNLDFPHDLHHSDSLQYFKTLYPDESTYALGALYESVLGRPMTNAHDAAADIDGMRDLILATKVHGKTLDDVSKLIVDHSESIGCIQKRCFKRV